MKKLNILSALLLLSFFVSCGDDDKKIKSTSQPVQTGELVVDISGLEFKGLKNQAIDKSFNLINNSQVAATNIEILPDINIIKILNADACKQLETQKKCRVQIRLKNDQPINTAGKINIKYKVGGKTKDIEIQYSAVVSLPTTTPVIIPPPPPPPLDEKTQLITVLKNKALNLDTVNYYYPQGDRQLTDRVDRLKAIHQIKTKNPECYIQIVQQRLKPPQIKRILAMERENNPRPLVFDSDQDWVDFKNDLKKAFEVFKGPDSHIVLLGSSTTYFSESPQKGQNSALEKAWPDCMDPMVAKNIYTFDNPGSDKSDIDINLLIPKLSELCQHALTDPHFYGGHGGNDGIRPFYGENLYTFCLQAASEPKIKNMVNEIPLNWFGHRTGETEWENNWKPRALKTGTALKDFYDKWDKKLGRPINISVRILPNDLKSPAGKPGKMTFENEPLLKSKFAFTIN